MQITRRGFPAKNIFVQSFRPFKICILHRISFLVLEQLKTECNFVMNNPVFHCSHGTSSPSDHGMKWSGVNQSKIVKYLR